MLQKTLDYACGAGADCGPIHQNGPCFNPNTVKSHCSYAVNSFFQKKGQSQGTCDFAGTATVSASDPTPSLMEALTTSRVVPLRVACRKLSSVSANFSCLEFKSYPCRSGRVSVMNHPKLLRPVSSSLQPQELSALGHEGNVVPSKEILDLWRDVEAVCFDVDSTVCVDEGIDELAEFCGAGKAVSEWTARAMGGSVPFEEALAARLSLFKPSLSKVEEYLQKRPPRLSPGIEELVKKLRANKIDVYLISGGFRQMINPVASILGIPRENIFANNILFGNSGEFVGFDENEPTSRSGGKAKAVQQIRETRLYKTMAMIGDGATDLEARKPGGADLFICYAGVQLREAVAAQADWLIFKFEPLLNSLD
ncbi:phosphoserine phosphatase, chloroplastic isoform X2 [Brassica rapa]|nr:phosphoserine phosphatase, chloroplastic isoform X2 [Brassica rapa]